MAHRLLSTVVESEAFGVGIDYRLATMRLSSQPDRRTTL